MLHQSCQPPSEKEQKKNLFWLSFPLAIIRPIFHYLCTDFIGTEMNKSSLRSHYKALRAALSPQQREAKSIAIAQQTLQLPIWHLRVFHLFLPIQHLHEVETQYLIRIFKERQKEIVLPKTHWHPPRLTHILWTPQTTFSQNQWGITEPESGDEISPHALDVVFIPLLAYDQQGNRVGYGKGFYDVFLSQCPATTLKIGLSFFAPIEKIEDVSQQDVPLDYCVTPQRIYRF